MGIHEYDYEYIYNLVLFGSIKIIRMWVDNEFKQSPEIIVNYISKLSKSSLSAFVGEKDMY